MDVINKDEFEFFIKNLFSKEFTDKKALLANIAEIEKDTKLFVSLVKEHQPKYYQVIGDKGTVRTITLMQDLGLMDANFKILVEL